MVVIELDQPKLATVNDPGLFGKGVLVLEDKDIDELIPKENRFCEYIHDHEALDEITSYLRVEAADSDAKPYPIWIWEENPESQFWLAPRNRKMLETVIDRMNSSTLGPKKFARTAYAWLQKMADRYGDLILLSDTSNFDWSWFDHYILKHEGIGTVNHATNNGFVIPIDATSYFFGLTRQVLTFRAWDNFNSKRALLDAGFILPDTSLVIDPNSHNPLDDAINIALVFASITSQLCTVESSKKHKRDE